MAGAVEERSTITVDDLRARPELGISRRVSDALLERWLLAAKQAADRFLCNDFVELDDDFVPVSPAVELAIPEEVEEGVVQWVRGKIAANAASLGVVVEAVGSISKSYDSTRQADRFYEGARAHWTPYRLVPGI